ncbi:Transcription-associated protein 1 [Nosema granulosis]|uniref:Transcription-associated protein 1 n=1 Tax=Nosema granulosis TaxID=83296 RepID=A0A9P6GYU7_9MICR|nr:Transcription-associated protein 1 [Nosema granulosis]
MNFKDIILTSDSLEIKVKNISKLFECDEFLSEALFSSDFLDSYTPFAVLVLNTSECDEDRSFILKSLNKFLFKKVDPDFVESLHGVLQRDNLTNVILALKIFASLCKCMNPREIEQHLEIVVELVNRIFEEEEKDQQVFFTIVQVFGYISDVVQRQHHVEDVVEGIIHRAVTFYRLFLEHRRVVEMIKYNKLTALEMVSSLSKLFKMASESKIFLQRNDVLNSTIFELAKFALFYCPTDAIELRKELFYYIFKILLRNKDMYLPKIEEFFDMRFFYLEESFLLNIKGLIGLTDMACVFSDNLSRRVPYELQRRTMEILSNNIAMINENDILKESSATVTNLVLEDENKLKYEKSQNFHLEIIYECVNLIFKQQITFKKYGLQQAEAVDFSHKQFLMIDQILETLKIVPNLNIFLSLSKPLKEMTEDFIPVERLMPVFENVLELTQKMDVEDENCLKDILGFFLTPISEIKLIGILKRLVQQMFRDTKRVKIFLEVLKRPNMPVQIIVEEIIKGMVSTVGLEKDNSCTIDSSFKTFLIGFISEVYNFNPGLISRNRLILLVDKLIQDEDWEILLFLLGVCNIKTDKAGTLHVYFYKKLHFLVKKFYLAYESTKNSIFLDIIFSLPININTLASDWRLFIGPIRSSLEIRNEITVKAISLFIHMVEGSKGDIFKGEADCLFEQIFDLLDDPRFVISCSQLIGRLKSYHKHYLSSYRSHNNDNSIIRSAIDFLKNCPTSINTSNTKKEIEIASKIIKDFLFYFMGWDVYERDDIVNRTTALLKDLMMEGKRYHKHLGFTDLDLYIANVLGIPYEDQLEKSELVFDSIVALIGCSSTTNLLKDIYEVVAVINFIRIFYYPIKKSKVLFNGNIFVKALVESFSRNPQLSKELLQYFLDKYVEIIGNPEDLYEYQILPELISYLINRNCWMGLNAVLSWDSLPSSFIPGDLKRILDCLLTSTSTSTTDGILHLINRKDTLSCISFIFKWSIDNIVYNGKSDLCKEILKMLHRRYDKLFIAMFKEKLRGFFYGQSDLREAETFFTKVDLFIFFVKNSQLFSKKETVTLVKSYYYYILSCNFFITPGKYRNTSTTATSTDVIYYYFYTNSTLENEEKYFFYLVQEILFMHLAFSKKKDPIAFDYVFSSLLVAPLRTLLSTNKPVITELLKDKYEECFSSTLSVEVVDYMLTIFSVIEMEEDEKLLNFILKIFEECKTQGESVLCAENWEASIYAKTFELSLKYPDPNKLYRSIIRVAYPWLYQVVVEIDTFRRMLLEYIEKNSFLCFPLIVRECVEESMLDLCSILVSKSVSFRNFVNNLPSSFVEETLHSQYFLDFLRIIEYEYPASISAALKIYADPKIIDKRRIKAFLKFSINRFTESDLGLLFSIDPLLKLENSCSVKMFNQSLKGSLLKSINKKDIKSFENLVRFYGDQSWMLIELFVEVGFYSQSMIEFCRKNLKDENLRSILLYYLCTFEPLPEYFSMLLNLSFEERKYTLYCLRRVVDKFLEEKKSNTTTTNTNTTNTTENTAKVFENTILYFLKEEIKFKTNIHILYPLLSYAPSLITPAIGRELVGIIYRLLNTFVPFHQKIGSQLFDALYSTTSTLSMRNLYTLLVVNFFHSKKSTFLPSYDLEILFGSFQIFPESLNFSNLLAFLEVEILSKKSTQYKISLATFLLDISRNVWYKHPLSTTTLEFLHTNNIVDINVDTRKETEINTTTLFNTLSILKEVSCYKTLLARAILEKETLLPNLLTLSAVDILPVDFVIDILPSVSFRSIKEVVRNIILENKATISQSVALLCGLKALEDVEEEEMLNLSLGFFLRNKFCPPGILNGLNDVFYRGCVYPDEIVRNKYIQLLSEILPTRDRLAALLGLDWTGVDRAYLPYLFAVLLLDTEENIKPLCLPMYVRGVVETPFLFYDNSPPGKTPPKDNCFYFFQEKHIQSFLDRITIHQPFDFRNDLINFLYLSPEACLSIISRSNSLDLEDVENVDWSFFGDKLTYAILKSSKSTTISSIGHRTFYHLLNISPPEIQLAKFREMGLKDYSYGCLRTISKFPEVMQASLFQQLGKYKQAQKIYEDLQEKCCESKVSFYEDEYDNILKEWVECAKEMQQWDICYNLGKFKGDTTLSADSLFFTSNFNISTERESFSNMVNLMENGIKKSFYKLFYELFYSSHHVPSSETFVNLLSSIVDKINRGPRTGPFNDFYSTLIQIVLEMHDTTSLFTFRADTEERINGLIYSWEDKEPLLESQYDTLLLFSTWRRHFWRRVEGYSNEGTLLDYQHSSEIEESSKKISSIVNKNKEFSENIAKFRKAMYTKGNNGLGRNANFLALAAYKKGYFDNALFLLREVFELPSIKILDAYRKVVYELMCFYEMGEYKLGLDLANSTNIVHFSDEQSSNIFRIRGMFSEKIGDFEDTKKLYFQAIQFYSSAENFFYYNTLLIKHFKIFQKEVLELAEKKSVDSTSTTEIIEEIISSSLQGLAASDSFHSKNLISQLILILRNYKISLDLALFKSLVNSSNLPFFVFFIPQLVDLLLSENWEYIRVILRSLMKNYSQPIHTQVSIFLSKNKNYPREKLAEFLSGEYADFLCLFEDLRNEKYFEAEYGILEALDGIIASLVSGEDLKEEMFQNFNTLVRLTDKCEFSLDTIIPRIYIQNSSSSLNLNEALNFLVAIKRELKGLLKASQLVEMNEKIATFNKILLSKTLPPLALFGSYNKISKDYADVVYVESLDSSNCNLIKTGKHSEEINLIGSDGRLYKYEFHTVGNNPSHSFLYSYNSLYSFLAVEINSYYKLRTRDISFNPVQGEEIGQNVFVEVFDSKFVDFENILERDFIRKKATSQLVEFVKGVEKEAGIFNEEEELSLCDIERNILNLLRNKETSQVVFTKQTPLNISDVFGILKDKLVAFSLPKISNKARLRVYKEVLPSILPVLPSFFSDDAYSYFMQRNAFSKSYALNLSLNNFLMQKTKDPENDCVKIGSGEFFRRNLSKIGNNSITGTGGLYISPGIQEFVGIVNIEGPMLSCLYFSSELFLNSESCELALRLFCSKDISNFEELLERIKENLERIVGVDGNDHKIVRVLNEWTDVGSISKNNVFENPWL